jgi:hypothetical protein
LLEMVQERNHDLQELNVSLENLVEICEQLSAMLTVRIKMRLTAIDATRICQSD